MDSPELDLIRTPSGIHLSVWSAALVSWQWEPGGEASGGIRGSEKAGMQHAGSQPAHPRPQRGAASADAAVGCPDPVLRPIPCSYLI